MAVLNKEVGFNGNGLDFRWMIYSGRIKGYGWAMI